MTEKIDFKSKRKERQYKRWANMEYSTQKLRDLGIPFKSHQNGFRLTITFGGYKWVFYPSTGFYERLRRTEEDSLIRGRGVRGLIKDLDWENLKELCKDM